VQGTQEEGEERERKVRGKGKGEKGYVQSEGRGEEE
jgi:hypothetical protein